MKCELSLPWWVKTGVSLREASSWLCILCREGDSCRRNEFSSCFLSHHSTSSSLQRYINTLNSRPFGLAHWGSTSLAWNLIFLLPLAGLHLSWLLCVAVVFSKNSSAVRKRIEVIVVDMLRTTPALQGTFHWSWLPNKAKTTHLHLATVYLQMLSPRWTFYFWQAESTKP